MENNSRVTKTGLGKTHHPPTKKATTIKHGNWPFRDLFDRFVTFSRAVGVELRNNLVHELGAFEKQSSMLFLAKACGVYAHHNVFFNGTLLIVLSSFCFATCFERLSCVKKRFCLPRQARDKLKKKGGTREICCLPAGPRAGININDGFCGGHRFKHNIIFNTVSRETVSVFKSFVT